MLKKIVRVALCAGAGVCALGLSAPARAGFVLFDNFNNYTDNATLVGQGPAGNTWAQTALSGAQPSLIQVHDVGGGNKVVRAESNATTPGNGAANRALTTAGLAISNSSTAATVFWQFKLGAATPNNWNFVVTDVTAPPDTAGSSEVQFNFDSATPYFRARSGGSFLGLSIGGNATSYITPVAGATYNVWFEINNSADTYRVFIQSNDPATGVTTRTQALASDGSGGTFKFRNSATALQSNDLINVNFGSGNGQANTTDFDNIYVDLAGINSTNPVVVPEPGTLGLLAGMGLLLKRRRSA